VVPERKNRQDRRNLQQIDARLDYLGAKWSQFLPEAVIWTAKLANFL